MANELRQRTDGVAGALDAALTAVATSMSSPALADLPAVGTTEHAVLSLFTRDATTGRITKRETVWVTAHTAAATTATILRAQEGTTAQAWAVGDRWVHGPTVRDTREGAWDLSLNIPLTTLADWTVLTGTWSADAVGIRQADLAVATQRLRYGALMVPARCIVEVELRVNAGSGWGGLVIGLLDTTTHTGASGVFLNTSASGLDAVYFEQDGIAAQGTTTLAASIAVGAFATLRAIITDGSAEAYLNGTLRAIGRNLVAPGTRPRLGLVARGSDMAFRNLKVWTPALPA